MASLPTHGSDFLSKDDQRCVCVCEQTLGACLLAQCLLAHHQVLVQKRLTLGLIDSEHICPKRAYSQQIRRKYTLTLHERETQQEPLPWDPKRPNDPR